MEIFNASIVMINDGIKPFIYTIHGVVMKVWLHPVEHQLSGICYQFTTNMPDRLQAPSISQCANATWTVCPTAWDAMAQQVISNVGNAGLPTTLVRQFTYRCQAVLKHCLLFIINLCLFTLLSIELQALTSPYACAPEQCEPKLRIGTFAKIVHLEKSSM